MNSGNSPTDSFLTFSPGSTSNVRPWSTFGNSGYEKDLSATTPVKKVVAATAYRIANDEVFAHNAPGSRPGRGRSRVHELRRLTLQLRVFLDSLDSNLRYVQ